MNFTKWPKILMAVSFWTIAFFMSIATWAFARLLFQGLRELVLNGNIDAPRFSMMLVLTFISLSINYLRITTFEKRTHLFVYSNYVLVEPANRRDEES